MQLMLEDSILGRYHRLRKLNWREYYDLFEEIVNKMKSEEKPSYSKRNSTTTATISNSNRFISFLFLVQFIFLCNSFIWESDVDYPLATGSSIAFTGKDHLIYVFGGFNGAPVNNSYKFNASTGSSREWIPIKPMPMNVYYVTGCASNDGRFFIFGGGSIDIQIYNPTDDSWTTATPNLPSGTSTKDYYMSCAVDSSSGLMYITGGANDGKRFYSYNVNSNTITNLANSSSPSPFYLNGQGSFVANDSKLYVFGGEDSNSDYPIATTYIYDIAKGSWSTGNDMKRGIVGFGYATDGSRLYVIGGYVGPNIYADNTQIYDISSGVWSFDYRVVYSRGIYSNVAVFLDGNLHSIGGISSNYRYLSIHQITSLEEILK